MCSERWLEKPRSPSRRACGCGALRSLPGKLETEHQPRVVSTAATLRTYGSQKLPGKSSASTNAHRSSQGKMPLFCFLPFLKEILHTSISLKAAASCTGWSLWRHRFWMAERQSHTSISTSLTPVGILTDNADTPKRPADTQPRRRDWGSHAARTAPAELGNPRQPWV